MYVAIIKRYVVISMLKAALHGKVQTHTNIKWDQ